MSIIEQAARRLEELRRSGVQIGPVDPAPSGVGSARNASAQSPAPADARLREIRRGEAPETEASTPVVELDFGRLAAMGYVTPDHPRSTIAEEFRVVKRPLLDNIRKASGTPGGAQNLVMVTSSMPGEGKTFVAVNLAMSLAMELDLTVLLVDADVSRPSVLSRLGLPSSRGLLDVLTDPSLDVSDALLRTNVPGLTLLPAGAPHGKATEILASDSMSRMVRDLSTRYHDRVVVFDTPPLLPSTESRVLATRMGQVILVVEAENTANKTVSQALVAIENCPVVLPLLNKTDKSEVGSYYGMYGPIDPK